MEEDLHVEITSEADSDTKLDVEQRGHEAVVDEPSKFGGEDEGPNPLEYMFTGLAGCINVTLHHVAMEKDIDIKSLEIDVNGDIDLEKFMKGTGERAGFQEIKIHVEMETDADAETEAQMLEEAEQRCPVSDNIQNPTDVEVEIE